MKSEQIKEITDKAIGLLVAALQRGHSQMLTAYLKAIGRFHRYSLLRVPQHKNENVYFRTMLIGTEKARRHASVPDLALTY